MDLSEKEKAVIQRLRKRSKFKNLMFAIRLAVAFALLATGLGLRVHEIVVQGIDGPLVGVFIVALGIAALFYALMIWNEDDEAILLGLLRRAAGDKDSSESDSIEV